MSQVTKQGKRQRVPLGALVDAVQRDRLVELAHREDMSMSAIVRRALTAELDRAAEAGETRFEVAGTTMFVQ